MGDPVLVVGAGPTGLTAALELARLGVPVRVVDRLPRPRTTSRAIGIQARTLELMAQRGLADELVRLGHAASGVTLHGGGRAFTRLDLSRINSPYNFILLLAQSETERVLAEALARRGVAVERGVGLVGLAQDPRSPEPSPVHAVLRRPDGSLEEAGAPWLIGAEGAHSVVRETLDIRFEGKTLEATFALGDVRMEVDLPETDFHAFSSEHGPLILFPFGGGRFRLVAGDPPEQGREPTLAQLQAVWDQRAGVPARLHDLGWASFFRVNSRMVPRLRAGRLLLGGDAAHIHSPAGGQGMNTGIQDMINLGWKLAAVMRGRAPPELLDTYGDERLPIIRDVLQVTERLTGAVGSEQPLVRGLVNLVAPLAGRSDRVQETATARMSQIALNYRGSPLSEDHAPAGHLRAGDRAPPIRVREDRPEGTRGASLLDLLDLLDPVRPAVLVVGEERDAEPDRIGLACAGLPVHRIAAPEDEAGAERFRSAFGGHGLFLVRPDGYVGFAGGSLDASALIAYAGRWFPAGAAPG